MVVMPMAAVPALGRGVARREGIRLAVVPVVVPIVAPVARAVPVVVVVVPEVRVEALVAPGVGLEDNFGALYLYLYLYL
jgi:hypothetical protein